MKVTKENSEDLSFVLWCLASEAIDREEFKEWVLYAIETLDDPPVHIIDLLDSDASLTRIYQQLPFNPAWSPKKNEINAISGITLNRGISPFESVDEKKCLQALIECPHILNWFHSMFPKVALKPNQSGDDNSE